MKKIYSLLLALCFVSANVSAAHHYVVAGGTSSPNGESWETAYAKVDDAQWALVAGDTVFVAAGTYAETISIKDGITYLGGYDPATGERDIEANKTIFDGTGLSKMLLVKYDAGCENPTLVEGFTFQNTSHSSEGGGAYIRANITLRKCTFKNCVTTSSGGAVYNDGGIIDDCVITNCKANYGGGVYNNSGTIKNSIIELNVSTSRGGAVYQSGASVLENSIIRGNSGGKYGIICNYNTSIIRNCVIHNNTSSLTDWPSSGGVYNPEQGVVVNCIIACNTGSNTSETYAGIHSGSLVYNTITWNNIAPETCTNSYTNYIVQGTNNASDSGNSEAQDAQKLSANNEAEDGPQFVKPTTFAGIPTTDEQISEMRTADFSFLATSPCIDKGIANEYTVAYDINGVERPQGEAYDLGAYEYKAEEPAGPVIKEFMILPGWTSLQSGKTLQFTIEVFDPADAVVDLDDATWTITQGADLATISETGLLTVKADLTAEDLAEVSQVTVLATIGEATSEAYVAINPAGPVAPEMVNINPEFGSIEAFGELQLSVETYPAGEYTFIWETNSDLVTISQDGLLTSISGAAGEVTVYAYVDGFDGIYGEATYTHLAAPASGITYELNGGSVNEYGWSTAQDMYNVLTAMADDVRGATRTWLTLAEINAAIAANEGKFDSDHPGGNTFGGGTSYNTTEEQATAWAAFQAHEDWSKFEWLWTYLAKTKGVDALDFSAFRFEVSGFFADAKYDTWPRSADYTTCGVSTYSAYASTWKSAFANPTEVEAEFTLNAPYKENSVFLGWFDNPDGTGTAITTIDATTEGTLYAIWQGTGGGTALENVNGEVNVIKVIENGQVVIIRDGVRYNVLGSVIK